MRRIISIVIAATMLLSSCELIDFDKDDEGSESSSATVTIPTQYTQVDIAPESTTQEVTFTATESWEISLEETKATPTWVTVSPMSGDAGDITLTITLESNTETEDRSTVITIISGGEESEIVVTQQAAEESYEELDDRAILMELYEATDGDNWTDNTNWGSDEPLGDWYGVDTDSDEKIISLELYGNSLSGTIPESIGNLESLNYLSLGNNSLTGEIPESMGDLINLISLSLDNNTLSGSIPDSFKNLKYLNRLFLGWNELSGTIPEWIVDLTNLTYIQLVANQFTGGIPSSIGNLTNLTTLWLDSNSLSGTIPESIGNLENLTYLNLAYNLLSGEIPAEIGDLVNLECLYLMGNNLTGVVPQSVLDLEETCFADYVITPQNSGYSFFEGIYTIEEFLEFVNDVNSGKSVRKNKMLMTDIDLSTIDFEPIGNGDPYIYYGKFDGNNHTIKNLSVDRSSVWDVGLFGVVSPESEVSNIRLSNVNISGGGSTGAIAGRNYCGVVRDCIVESGNILANDQNLGGIVGYNYDGTVSGCINNCDVESSGGGFVGGIVGFNEKGDVVECNNSGSVYSYGSDNLGTTGYLGVGGIVGNNLDNASVIACYNTGSIKGSECVGGVVGRNYADVDICYNKGDVEATMIIAFVGGIIGSNKNGGVVTSCYNTGSAENINATNSDVASKTSAGAVAGYNDGTFVACCYNSTIYALGGLSSVAGSLDGASKGLDYSMMNDALSSDIPYRYTTSGAIEYTE